MTLDDVHEFGDSWYGLAGNGTYVVIKSLENGGAFKFTYGYKPLFPEWALYVVCAAGGVLALVCLFLCFCYIRRKAKESANEANRVKKYQADSLPIEDKLSRFKYGRQSAPLSRPVIEENDEEEYQI